jgi:acetoin utilization deacetylase AcuC-like enzyme
MPSGTGFVCDARYLDHTLGEGHPESAQRLAAIGQQFHASGLDLELTDLSPSIDPGSYIGLIHSDIQADLVQRQAYDHSICRLAVSGVLTAVDAVCRGDVRNAFCAVRPPGHHATNDGEFGFCFYNNIAIAARYGQQEHGLQRILIADWDFHHGNGTEWAFYDDPTVFFFSTHRLWAFPGTGLPERRGESDGEGYNLNVPLPGGARDSDILWAFETQLMPLAEKFRPELVLISAGFDSREHDFLGDFAVTDAGFVRLTELMMSLAETYAQSRLVAVLEGGYNPQGLASAAAAHVAALLDG